MSAPREPKDQATDLIDAEELARQRALALELRDIRLKNRIERDLETTRRRDRRAADLLRIADALNDSGVAQRDFVMHPRATKGEAEPAPKEPAPKSTKAE